MKQKKLTTKQKLLLIGEMMEGTQLMELFGTRTLDNLLKMDFELTWISDSVADLLVDGKLIKRLDFDGHMETYYYIFGRK